MRSLLFVGLIAVCCIVPVLSVDGVVEAVTVEEEIQAAEASVKASALSFGNATVNFVQTTIHGVGYIVSEGFRVRVCEDAAT
jgi:hypothetical protein